VVKKVVGSAAAVKEENKELVIAITSSVFFIVYPLIIIKGSKLPSFLYCVIT